MATVKKPLRVTGDCPKCSHTVTTNAPAGRATWRGPCPAQGCTGVVVARRTRPPGKPAEPDPPPAPPAEPPPARRPRRKVISAGDYDRGTKKAGDGPAGVRRPEQPAPGRPPADSPEQPGDPGKGAGNSTGNSEPAPAGQPPAEPKREPQRPAASRVPEQRRRTVTPWGHLY